MTTTSRITAAAARSTHRATAADSLASRLRPLDDRLTLKMFGEDDCGSAKVSQRRGPVKSLTREVVAQALGMKVAGSAEMAERVHEFRVVKKNDAEFWRTFLETQEEPGVGDAAKALLTGKNVAEVVAMVIDEKDNRRPFGATAALCARMTDGSLVVLRGVVGACPTEADPGRGYSSVQPRPGTNDARALRSPNPRAVTASRSRSTARPTKRMPWTSSSGPRHSASLRPLTKRHEHVDLAERPARAWAPVHR